MLSRTLLVALCIVYVTPLTPLVSPGDGDCALYLTGPGRSSAYDYSLNLLKGNFAYDGQHSCITYEAINQAYLDARTRILVSQPKGDWKAENFASVGELLLDVSISLARTYGLTYEEIEKGLPLIDTSRTLIREVCPPVFSHVECRAGKYRRLDGLCNNLRHPTWGATMAPFQRLIGPLFADGINAPRISHTGRDLPLSRVVSRTMHPDDGFHDHAGTVMVIAWGQFMDHDYTLTGTPLDPVHRNDPEECCKRPPHLKHPYCNEIRVPDDDYFYRLFNVKCIDFVRGFPSPRPGCRLGSRVPFNTLTGAIDGNTVYGVTEKFARKLRTGYGGLLRMNPVFKEYGLKDLLPLKLDIPDEGCTRPNKNMFCFEAGEIRVNEQLVLTVMHTLMAREHNRVAEALATVNPHWDDETLFQESRRINIAEIQHITYNEFLPILLGKDVMEKFGLVLEKEGYWDGYDENVNPDVIASFAAAAYRFGHSLLPTAVERWSKAHKFIASKRLSDLIRRPYDLYRAGVLDEYVMGLMNQVAQAMDDSITQEVTNHLFKKVGARFGMDLVSFNMQRGREFGLPGYMEFRKFCGLSGADSFQDLFGSMANETIQKYESIFEHPIDVDLWSGGVSERPLPGSMLGPTFACIIATQFSYSRRGDRFWFELPNQPSSFTPEQIIELKKARLARVICDNTDIIDTVQLYPMVLPDHELNPRVPCRSGIIPSMDFSKWAEPTPFHGGAKEYMTDAHICNQTILENNTTATTDTSDDCTVNNASNDFLQQDQCGNDDLVIVANNNDNNKQNETEENNTDNNSNDNLEENCESLSANLENKLINQVKNSDIVLKYVYKKIDLNASKKTRGHLKNSLKRKKRSLISDSETHSHRYPRKFQINDQQTDREELSVPQAKPQGVIDSADLADFNIETLHENIKPSIGILLNDNQRYNKDRQNHHIKKYVSDGSESDEDSESGNIKSTVYDDDGIPTKYPKKSKIVESKIIDYDEKDGTNSSESDENDEMMKNGYIGESENVNSNEYKEKEDKSNEYIEKDKRDIERTSLKNIKSNDYNKESKNDNSESSEYELKDKKNKDNDFLYNIDRNNKYTAKSKHDNHESNRYGVKDKRNKESDSINRDDRSNDYTKESENNNYESNEYVVKDNINKESDTFNQNPRSNEYIKESENDSNQSNEYEEKDKDNIKDSDYENNTRKKQFNIGESGKPDSNEFLTDYKDPLINDERLDADSFTKRELSPRNNKNKILFDAFKKPNTSNASHENNIEDLNIDERNIKQTSYESSEDIEKTKLLNRDNEEITADKNQSSSINLEEVNLDDFNHESIQDEKEKNKATILESIKSTEKSFLPENVQVIPNTLEKPSTDTNLKSENQIKINDDEIKPVKELHNGESQSEEESKESTESEESENKEKSINDRLKSVVEKSHKEDPISKKLNEKEKHDVKAQFERIPENYIHTDVKNKTTEKKNDSKNSDEEGTLDAFILNNYEYDKDLNIKFSDLTIKLPEIKLPEDILAYAREERKNDKEDYDNSEDKEKDNSEDKDEEEEQQEDEELEEYIEKAKKQRNNKQNREDFYQSYFNPQNVDLSDDNPQKKEKYSDFNNGNSGELNSGEDLYEKFVRERFGKRSDLKKRSEKLIDYEPISKNYNLYKTVRKALKRANKIEKEAEKSKDPNYMWTLEYGGKL